MTNKPSDTTDPLRKALREDFETLYVKQYTADWKTQRFLRNIEIGIMSLAKLNEYIEGEIMAELEKLTEQTEWVSNGELDKAHHEFWAVNRKVLKDRIKELKEQNNG